MKMGPRGHFSSIISQILLDVMLHIFKALIANRCLGPPGNCIDGVVHHELVPPGQTVKGHFYLQVFHRLCDAARSKWRDKWPGECFLHHDNAPTHTLLVQQFLAGKSIPLITQPP
jgi:hypothetical protein